MTVKETIFTDKDENGKPLAWKAISVAFIQDMKNLSPAAIVIYLYFRSCVNIEYNQYREVVYPSYNQIKENTGIKSNNTVSKAILELIESGWIKNVENPDVFNYKGNYYINNQKHKNKSLISHQRSKRKNLSDVAQERNRKRKESPEYFEFDI